MDRAVNRVIPALRTPARRADVSTLDRKIPPPSLPTPPPATPEFRETILAGGFRVRVAAVPKLPEVAIRLMVDGGAAAEPAADAGVAALTAKVLPAGAAGRTAMQMAEWLDHLGASIGSGVGHDSARFSLHTLSDTCDEALDYLASVVLAPSFLPDEVARVRAERLDEVRRTGDEPGELASEALSEAIFADHPYGRPVRGTVETLEALDGGKLRKFWERRYEASSSFLVAAGDVDPEAFVAVVERSFGAWAAGGGRTSIVRPPGPVRDAGTVTLVDRPGSRQSEIRIGAVGLARGDEDEIPVLVMNAILGGLFTSRINLNLREDKGWTYGARSGFSMRRAAGPFVASAAVDTPVTARAFEEMLSEIRSMTERPPSEDELAGARNALILSLPRQFETTSQVASKEAERVAYDLPLDWWEQFPDRVGQVGRDDVVRVAEQYLEPSGLVLVAVGEAEALRGDLSSFGTIEERAAP